MYKNNIILIGLLALTLLIVTQVPEIEGAQYRQVVFIDNVAYISSGLTMEVSTTTPTIYFKGAGGVGNEGPNMVMVATDSDGVPSYQLMIVDENGVMRLASSYYNDAFNTVYATWQQGHNEEHYTYSAINPNTVSRKMFIGSGDTANSGYTNVKFFQVFSDNGETETFAINGQTGEIYPKGNFVFRDTFSDIGDMINYVNAVYSKYVLMDVIRPLNGNSVAIQDKNGVPRFEFTDLESETGDYTIRPTVANTSYLGTRDAPFRGSVIRNLEIQNAFYLVDPSTLEVVAEINDAGFFYRGIKMVQETEFNVLETKLNNICSELGAQGIFLSSCN